MHFSCMHFVTVSDQRTDSVKIHLTVLSISIDEFSFIEFLKTISTTNTFNFNRFENRKYVKVLF